MKIVWLCNSPLKFGKRNGSGTWLDTLSLSLNERGVNLEIVALSDENNLREVLEPLSQTIIPKRKFRELSSWANIINSKSPDLVHLWGTENDFGELVIADLISKPVLLETQGLKHIWAQKYLGGLSFREILKCYSIKEIFKRKGLLGEQKDYLKCENFEKKLIAKTKYICVQTDWMQNLIIGCNSKASIYRNNILLRNEILNAQPWTYNEGETIFCSAGYTAPYKGLHTAVQVICKLKTLGYNINLEIAGGHLKSRLRNGGYLNNILKFIKDNKIDHLIHWLGPLDGNGIKNKLLSARLVLVPSHIENCCTALQEAMYVGVPVVCAYVGGLPEIAKDNYSALFFDSGDVNMCVQKIVRVLENRELSIAIGQNARISAEVFCSQKTIVEKQIEIYKAILIGK